MCTCIEDIRKIQFDLHRRISIADNNSPLPDAHTWYKVLRSSLVLGLRTFAEKLALYRSWPTRERHDRRSKSSTLASKKTFQRDLIDRDKHCIRWILRHPLAGLHDRKDKMATALYKVKVKVKGSVQYRLKMCCAVLFSSWVKTVERKWGIESIQNIEMADATRFNFKVLGVVSFREGGLWDKNGSHLLPISASHPVFSLVVLVLFFKSLGLNRRGSVVCLRAEVLTDWHQELTHVTGLLDWRRLDSLDSSRAWLGTMSAPQLFLLSWCNSVLHWTCQDGRKWRGGLSHLGVHCLLVKIRLLATIGIWITDHPLFRV
jgi:hypothetical protein